MNQGHQILAAVVGIAVIGAGIGEYRYRRGADQRYRQAVEVRRQLELQYGEMLATHEQLKGDLERERQRSQELSKSLTVMSGRLEETVGHLTEETRKSQEFQTRMSVMQQHIDQLQSELALAVPREDAGGSTGAGAVELQRIVVSNEGTSALSGRVMSINHDWNFVVIDLGWEAVRIGDTVSIFRGEELLAKARVERIQEGICAATVLPEWRAADIHVNDLVKLL